MIDLLLWLPFKVAGYFLRPVTAMMEDLADNANQAIKEYAEEHDL